MISEWSKYYLEDRIMLYCALNMDGGSIHQSEGDALQSLLIV